MTTAREHEAMMLARCTTVAQQENGKALNDCEANVYRLASMLIRSQFAEESNRLRLASENYFSGHPSKLLSTAELVRNGWVISLPRFRDMLSRKFLVG